MTRFQMAGIALGAVLATGATGYHLGARYRAPAPAAAITTAPIERKLLYYRDPDGKADFSPTAKATADGRAYVAVFEDEEAGFAGTAPPQPKGNGKVKFYRNPMGLPDTSPVPKDRKSVV